MGEPSLAPNQLIAGYEIKEVLSKGDKRDYNWGDTILFPFGNDVICQSRNNHLEFQGYVEKRLRTTTGDNANPWIKCTGDEFQEIVFHENFAAAMVPEVIVREGLNTLEVGGLLPKCRYLEENFEVAHISPESKIALKYNPNDSNDKVYMTDKFTPGNDDYDAWAKGVLKNGFALKYSPKCFPFRFAHPTIARDILFPNMGAEATLQVTLAKSCQELFYVPFTDAVAKTLPTHEFRIRMSKVKLFLIYPRMTAAGLKIIKNPSLRPLIFPGDYALQYSFTISPQSADQTFNIQNIRLPHYIKMQLYNYDYFVPEKDSAERRDRRYLPLDLNLKNIKIRYGTRDLSFNVANFNYEEEASTLLRQDILKRSNIFDVPVNQNYFAKNSDMQKHVLISFCSNENTRELLVPIDAPFDKDSKQNLTISLIGADRTYLTPGRLIFTFIYKDLGYKYDMSRGTFIEPNIRASVLST